MIQSDSFDYDGYRARRIVPNLDGLRALAILLVLVHHTTEIKIPLLANFQHNGRLGVSVFFVISGFLICTLFLRERDRFGNVDLKSFYLRRIYRLFPLYYAVLFLECLLVFVVHAYSPENRALFVQKLPSYLFYYSNWLTTATQGPFFVSWSLAIEEQFYLAFGLMFAFLRRRLVVGLLIAAYLCKFLLLNLTPLRSLHPDLPWAALSTIQSSILFGVLAAYLLHSPRGYAICRKILAPAAMPWIILACMLGWLSLVRICLETNILALTFNALAALLVISLSIRDPVTLIGGRALSYVGKISYGIYLLHMPVYGLVKQATHQPLVVLLLGVSGVLIAASLSYHFYEKPFLRLKERLHRG
jgi:peptidoglycan/LPS O-acetylase OafA/YrhL